MKLYEYFENLTNNELLEYVEEIKKLDDEGVLPQTSACRNLLTDFPNSNLNNIRAEMNYELSKRFIDLMKNENE